MFQDEARFGRMVRIRRCWSPAPQRPVVANGYEREFQYVYGTVSPLAGELDWLIRPAMNTEQMGTFLAPVSAAHPRDFIVMVVDGASSHVAKALVRAGKYPPAPAAGLFARTQSPGTSVG